jgi:hypothetical protein
MSFQDRIKLLKLYLNHRYIFKTEMYIIRILIILAFLIMSLIPFLCSCATIHKSYCEKKQAQHLYTIYKSGWWIHPVRHLPKSKKYEKS